MKTPLAKLPVILLTSICFLGIPAVSASDHAAASHTTAHAARGLAFAEAYSELQKGNARFVAGKSLHRKQDPTRRKELAAGQKPHAVILSCSDSRVPPELVFDQGLGEVFPIRVAGNILGAAQVASIEYAVEHLGSNLIVVMGHESCGAVKAALGTKRGETTGSIDLDSLISSVQGNLSYGPNAEANRMVAAEDKKLRAPVMANVDAVASSLANRSKILKKYIGEGQVKIIKGVYSLESGKVDFWDDK